MPQIVGRKVTPSDGQTIADSLRSIGDSIYKPIDPVTQETMKQLQMQAAKRTNMMAALQRGDALEYEAQAFGSGIPFDDALGYARLAGLIGPDWKPTRPLYDPSSASPQPPAPMATGSNTATPQLPQPPTPLAPGSNAPVMQITPQTNASSPWG